MKKIAIGGQLEQEAIKAAIEKYGNQKFEIEICSDMDAAMKVQSGAADYYFGACNTGGGGALAMAIAMLTAQKTVTVAGPSNKMSEAEIKQEIKNGKIAFGMVSDAIDEMIPLIIRNL